MRNWFSSNDRGLKLLALMLALFLWVYVHYLTRH